MSSPAFPTWARSFRGFNLAQREVVRGGKADTSRLTCRASCSGDGAPPLCGEPAGWMLTAACVHEHTVPSLACGPHADSVRRKQERGGIICTPCAHGGAPHSCPVTIEFCALPVSRAA
jgi:hypothetical protein